MQEQSGFELDTTLGFNEIPGFRNSAALKMPAWIASEKDLAINFVYCQWYLWTLIYLIINNWKNDREKN